MLNTTNQDNPKTWLERLQQDKSSDQLDSIHEDVVDLFKITSVGIINDTASFTLSVRSYWGKQGDSEYDDDFSINNKYLRNMKATSH